MKRGMAGNTGLLYVKLIGPDIVKDTEEKVQIIQQRLKAANNRQKYYADLKGRTLNMKWVIKCS